MSLIRWEPIRNPWVGLFDLQHRMNRLFDELPIGDEESRASTWSPRIEFVETEGNFEVTAELPGMERDDVKIELVNNVLTIFGEKHAELKKDRKVYLCERVYGSFSRSFQLPAQVDAAKIKAEFKNGILTLNLPKVEEAKPKKIEIKAA